MMRIARGAVALLVLLVAAAGCSFPSLDGAVVTLAKVDGWRDGFTGEGPFAVLEIAYDDVAARALWEENVGPGLPERSGKPLAAGVYGDLDEVDFSEQVVGLFSSGQSGSCPGWLADVTLHADGTVDLTRGEDLRGGDGCTDDYNAYRTVVAIDRDDVPAREELGHGRGTVDGRAVLDAVVTEYPAAPGR